METVKSKFLSNKKDKAFCKFLKKWFQGRPVTDVEVAKNITSMLTHSLIEMEGSGSPMFRALDIPFQASMINRFLEGGMSADELRELYYKRFGSFI